MEIFQYFPFLFIFVIESRTNRLLLERLETKSCDLLHRLDCFKKLLALDLGFFILLVKVIQGRTHVQSMSILSRALSVEEF